MLQRHFTTRLHHYKMREMQRIVIKRALWLCNFVFKVLCFAFATKRNTNKWAQLELDKGNEWTPEIDMHDTQWKQLLSLFAIIESLIDSIYTTKASMKKNTKVRDRVRQRHRKKNTRSREIVRESEKGIRLHMQR